MDCRYRLLFLFLCGFAEPTVSSQTCDKTMLAGTPCSLKMTITSSDTPTEVKWVHEVTGSSSEIIHWKNSKIKGSIPGASLEEDKRSLTFKSISVENSGTYTYTVFNNQGTQIANGNMEIKVYAKILQATAKFVCNAENATITCLTGDSKDPEITWYKDNNIIQNEKKNLIFLTSSQIKESKPYSCLAKNPVSEKRSADVTVTCKGPGLGKLFGFDFWIMVSILAGGGALLLLLICVLIICACRSCRQHEKHQQDEAELRLQIFHDSENGGTSRSKHTARGQPAPPIPQEEPINGSPSPQTTPRIAAQPKAQTRARPPPPPQDDDGEDPPPLPRPRKQRKHRTQEPYRPME